jgi:hypothetical protein
MRRESLYKMARVMVVVRQIVVWWIGRFWFWFVPREDRVAVRCGEGAAPVGA